MAKITLDVEEIKKGLKSQALLAKTQLTELAKRAQKDLEDRQVLKRLEQVVEKVKSQEKVQELMKNPKFLEFSKRLTAASEQIEKTLSKNATSFIEEVRARISKMTGPSENTKAESKPAARKSKKTTSAE